MDDYNFTITVYGVELMVKRHPKLKRFFEVFNPDTFYLICYNYSGKWDFVEMRDRSKKIDIPEVGGAIIGYLNQSGIPID
ncbi:hypothetical protein GCM10023149_33500 [Mucilaginibacter gynuensis]|uniref:Uncharacterized protein n=1 Tax=Mucilaginibacter gynuensis TaxID=1302236 RepID=A0ABP8GSK2_9SPHI